MMTKINLQVHPHPVINGLMKYQLVALFIGIFTLVLFCWFQPSSVQFLKIGDLSVLAGRDRLFGITGKTSWRSNGIQLLVFISLATGVFMYFGLKQSNSLSSFQWWFFPYVLLFALTNSFVEEVIYRFVVVAGLGDAYPPLTIQMVSAILFGLPHFFGNPSGVVGVLMSGLLGYILCKATLETRGLSIAWVIHFVQDIIIFTGLMMMQTKLSDS